MAQMIPESVPSGRPRGEREVFDILQNLPDDYLVYYEPVISNRYPDFVVVCPDKGLMVIEVKDWLIGNIIAADDINVTMSMGATTKTVKHPRQQAKEYKFSLMNQFRANPAFDIIRHSEGQYAGMFLFPFGHMVVLSKIRFVDLEARGLTAVFPEKVVATRDILEIWKGLKPQDLAGSMESFFDPWWPITPLNHKQVNVLRATIHPEIIVRHVAPNPTRPTDRLLVLDQEQEVLARKIGDGHRIINGVAGAGKTILLIHRARWLASGDASKRIALLCFNRMLAAFLHDALSDVPNVMVQTFHKWGTSLKAWFTPSEQQFGDRLMKRVLLMKDEDKYDAILIDEAQDFHSEWLRCCVKALKDPVDGDLVVVADGNQGLYRPESFTWKEVGIKAQGRVIPLRRAYRNTEQILHLARNFAQDQKDDGTSIVSLKPLTALHNGPKPILFKASTMAEEMAKVLEILKGLLNGKWGPNDNEPPLTPSQIGIVYARKTRRTAFFLNRLLRELPTELGVPVVWLNDSNLDNSENPLKSDGIKIQTIQYSKGLQYRAVIFMWANQLPMKNGDENQYAKDCRLFYVALTRAERYLAVTYTGHSEFTDKLEKAAIGDQHLAFYCEHCGYHASAKPKQPVASNIQYGPVKCPKCSKRTRIEFPL